MVYALACVAMGWNQMSNNVMMRIFIMAMGVPISAKLRMAMF